LCTFKQLDWEKACGWFKIIVKDYTKAMQKFTFSGVHQPDFMGFVNKKLHTYYYRMYILANPECHKVFNVLLSDALCRESTNNKGGKNKNKSREHPQTTKVAKTKTRADTIKRTARVQTMKRRLPS
jgi:hypothetical protein